MYLNTTTKFSGIFQGTLKKKISNVILTFSAKHTFLTQKKQAN